MIRTRNKNQFGLKDLVRMSPYRHIARRLHSPRCRETQLKTSSQGGVVLRVSRGGVIPSAPKHVCLVASHPLLHLEILEPGTFFFFFAHFYFPASGLL